jgi:flagellar hook-length control protein FliK
LYETGEVGFTQQELNELRDTLLREGVSAEILRPLEQLASHPHGATLGQLLALMQAGTLFTSSLNPEETLRLRSFADGFDASGELGRNMQALLENGRPAEAWKLLKDALSGLNGEAFTLRADDAAALGKAFGLSAGGMEKILAQFGASDELVLTPELFGTLMVPLEDELQSREGQNGKLGTALAAHLQPLIEKARRRAESELQAAHGSDRASRHSEILIRDKVMSRFNESMAKAEGGEETRGDSNGGKKPGMETLEGSIRDDAASGETNARDAKEFSRGGNAGDARGVRDGGDGAGRERNRKGSALLESVFSRIEARGTHPGSGAGTANGAFAFTPPEGTPAGATPQPSNQAGSLRSHPALQQIEHGFLSRNGDGSQRLALQLDPAELGAVTLILTSGKGGEITALIRAEKSETVELVSRHLEVIRVNLEQQGLKVDKLEVQGGLVNDRDQQWQGAEQHNAMREEKENREYLERLRRLGRQGGSDEFPDRDMPPVPSATEYSGRGMHLVA